MSAMVEGFKSDDRPLLEVKFSWVRAMEMDLDERMMIS